MNSKYQLTSLLHLVINKHSDSDYPNPWVTFLMMQQLTIGLHSLMS